MTLKVWQAVAGTFLVILLLAWKRPKESFQASPDKRTQYLEDMVKYLKVVTAIHGARDDLYRWEYGYGKAMSSPRLDALEKQRLYMIEQVKKDPEELAFFRNNLTLG